MCPQNRTFTTQSVVSGIRVGTLYKVTSKLWARRVRAENVSVNLYVVTDSSINTMNLTRQNELQNRFNNVIYLYLDLSSFFNLIHIYQAASM